MTNHHYNHVLQPLAKNLRNSMTKAEACLWKYGLKAGRIMGYGFRRQRPILNYIADFVCLKLKLIIEVDGFTHCIDKVIDKDMKKQNDLAAAGYCVLRFSDNEVLKDISNVILRIEAAVREIEEKPDENVCYIPPPAPASGG